MDETLTRLNLIDLTRFFFNESGELVKSSSSSIRSTSKKKKKKENNVILITHMFTR
jgi:hypothetical protein